jgi:hypothetical protein
MSRLDGVSSKDRAAVALRRASGFAFDGSLRVSAR